jgi:hypothetical protein
MAKNKQVADSVAVDTTPKNVVPVKPEGGKAEAYETLEKIGREEVMKILTDSSKSADEKNFMLIKLVKDTCITHQFSQTDGTFIQYLNDCRKQLGWLLRTKKQTSSVHKPTYSDDVTTLKDGFAVQALAMKEFGGLKGCAEFILKVEAIASKFQNWNRFKRILKEVAEGAEDQVVIDMLKPPPTPVEEDDDKEDDTPTV